MMLTMIMMAGFAGAMQPTLFTGPAAAGLFKQCSRPTPPAGTTFTRPTTQEIARLEKAVATRRADVPTPAALRAGWTLEATATFHDGRRHVYGNYVPVMKGVTLAQPGKATVICDGGRRMFGIEIDASTGTVTHYAENGR